MSYPLPPGILSYCHGKWDDESKKFVSGDAIDVIQCCLQSCHPYIDFCFNSCHNAYKDKNLENKCVEECNELISDCETRCWEFPSEQLQDIRQCAEEKKCGKLSVFDPDCLKNNEDYIVKCCKNKSTFGQGDEYCDKIFRYMTGEKETPLTQLSKKFALHKHPDYKPNYTVIYIIVSLIVIFGIVILTKLK